MTLKASLLRLIQCDFLSICYQKGQVFFYSFFNFILLFQVIQLFCTGLFTSELMNISEPLTTAFRKNVTDDPVILWPWKLGDWKVRNYHL